jgi:S1-C subfamily serine protease
MTLIVVSFAALGHPILGFDLWNLLDASIFAAVAWGIYTLSRIASALGIFFFIVEQMYSWTNRTPRTASEFVGQALLTSILALMFVNGTRGIFAYHRHQRSAAASAAGTSGRWKVYSAVLASFVFGVLALRGYESLTSVAPVGNKEGSLEDFTALVKQVRPAVVTITTYNFKGESVGQGSGFFTSKDGEILTNHHVLKGADSASIKTNDGKTYSVAAVLADDPDSDLTEVMVVLDDDTPFLPLARQRAVAGQRIVVIGSPMGLEETVSEGIVSALPEERQEVGEVMPATLQITAPISEGSSGGPVVNLRGEVVGVATAYVRKSENLNFAIPLERVLVLRRIKPVALDIWSNPTQKPKARDFFVEGLAAMRLGDCEHGLESFRLALKKRPAFAAAWWGTGVCLMEKGAMDGGVASLKKASVLDPSFGLPHYALALAYIAQGKRALAYQEYQLLKGLDPNLAEKLVSELPK